MSKADEAGQKRRGRPRKAPVDGERKSISFRVTPRVYNFLVEAADLGGYSISEVVERHLERVAEGESRLFDPSKELETPQTGGLLEAQKTAIYSLEKHSGAKWHENSRTAVAVYAAVTAILAKTVLLPPELTMEVGPVDELDAELRDAWEVGVRLGGVLADPFNRAPSAANRSKRSK